MKTMPVNAFGGGGVKTLWSTLTGLKGNPGLVTCVCMCCRVSYRPVPLYTHSHNRTPSKTNWMTCWTCCVWTIPCMCSFTGERSVKYLHRKIQIDTKIWSGYRNYPVRFGSAWGVPKHQPGTKQVGSTSLKSLTWISSYEQEAPSEKTQLHFL